MKNAEKGRGIWSALSRWGLFALRCLALLGVMIVLFALNSLFLVNAIGSGYFDTLADFFGYGETDGLSAGAHFARNLALALLALVGIVMAAWRNLEMSRQADAAQKQIKNESNRIAGERFSDAVKMLAQNNEGSKPAIAARVGGIYALQSLANNYISQYAAQVVRILVAYVRENAQLTKIPYKEKSDMNFLGEDVKAAFAVLAQLLDGRDESPEKKFELSDNDLDFSECDFSRLCLNDRQASGLRHYKWQRADLQGSDLRGSDFRGSDLQCADFRKARMYDAQLQGTDLRGANLEGALLHSADLRGAELKVGSTGEKPVPTNLRGAALRYADLRGADLQGGTVLFATDLSRADLSGAKLENTNLRDVNLSGAQLPNLSSNQVMHSGQPELKGVKSIEMSSDPKWYLETYRDCPYALAGVLCNFHIDYRGLRKAMRKLLDDNKLPPGFPDILRKWLEKVDLTGSYPDSLSRNWRASK